MKRLASMFAVVVLMTMAGCATKSTVTPAPEKPLTAFGCPVGGKSVGSMEDLLASKVQTAGDVKDVKVSQMQCIMQGDLLRIDATLANTGTTVRRVAYRFEWVDRNGMKAWNDEVWKPVYLYEKSRETIVATAPASGAVDFKLTLLDADKER